jgi:hypothetical protein
MKISHLDTLLTGFTSICTIKLFSNFSAGDIQAIYSMFVQSLVAIAAIGKLLYDFLSRKDKTS